MAKLTEDENDALAAVLHALADPAAAIAVWQQLDLFTCDGEDGICITLGAPSRDLSVVAARYTAATGRGLPALLCALLEQHDGFNLSTTEDGRATLLVSADPICTNGLLAARHLESTETSDSQHAGLLIGIAYHQCRVVWAEEGLLAGAVIFDDRSSPSIVVAPDLATFFRQLARHGLSIEAVVEAVSDEPDA